MNRQIKFRAWLPETKTLIPVVHSIDWVFNKITYGWNREGKELKYNNFILQQFTGLLDKNGREIYEGDIVKYKRCHTIPIRESKWGTSTQLVEDGEFIGQIIFIFPSFCWSYDHKRYDDIEALIDASHRYEVIGNIFENPELLKNGI